MNDWNQTTQLPLFESESPDWRSLPCEAQQSVRHVLSQVLLDALQQQLDALEQHRNDPIPTSTTSTEKHDV